MSRGRPASPENQAKAKRALLDAANECLQEKSFNEISLREIGARANQNSAMVAYYFGNKESLFVELLYEAINSDKLGLLRDLDAMQPSDAEAALRSLITEFVNLHRHSPWLSRFIVDNVILSPGKLRKLFVSRVLASTGEKVLQLFTSLQSGGAVAGYYNPQFCRISLMSLMAFPFVAAPVLKDAFDFDIHAVDVDAWINHTVSILMMGLQAHDSSLSQPTMEPRT
jgi:AcrR family transcriptional regulator